MFLKKFIQIRKDIILQHRDLNNMQDRNQEVK